MEAKKIVYSIVLIIILKIGFSQERKDIVSPGLVRIMGTISPSKMLGNSGSYFYLHGNTDIYLNKNISFCGDFYCFSGGINGNNDFSYNHNIFYGYSMHKSLSNNDLYFAIQPGCAITKLKTNNSNLMVTHSGFNPVMSFAIGDNFYISKFFHFFIQGRIVVGEHNYDFHKNISELRLSAGLGFNLNTLK